MARVTRTRGATHTAGGWRVLMPRRRQMLLGLLLAFLASVVLVAIGYAVTPIPEPNQVAIAQATTLYYSDGKTVLARLGSTTRVDVPLNKVPKSVQQAVLAAEDRHFYSEPGISPTGILRALWTDLRGGEISQGGSTITQQYVKNFYLTSQRTFTRKFREIFISIKVANSQSKDQILEDYLNTIYFGRGAYGIQAATHAYFGQHTDVSDLDAAQGAVLAALISNPGGYDPTTDPAAARDRWHYVIDGMVAEHWLTSSQAQSMHYPHVRKKAPRAVGDSCSGDIGFICQAVQLELARDGFDQARLDAGGYRVVTTIDKNAQAAAEQAMADNGGRFQRSGVDKGREAGLVSVQPGDGAIRAMYGGAHYCPTRKHPDSCTDLSGVTGYFGGGDYTRPPGSSFKPYTLIAALKQGIGLDSTFHGPPSIDIDGTTIHNSEGESCSTCTLLQALAESINTIFVPLAQQVGPGNVVKAAYDAGIPHNRKLGPYPAISLGPDSVSPLDQAVGYATIAAQGERADPYLVDKVETQKHDVVYSAKPKTTHVFPADVMADTTYAMTKVFDCGMGGTACGRALSGRPAAGKTGTNGSAQGGNLDAWFIGFTPQLSTAVWYGNVDRHKPVTTGGVSLYGGMLPAATWQEMMNAALQGEPPQSFPPPAHVGSNQGNATPTPPSTSPTATATESSSPSPSPSASLTPTLLPSKSSSPSPSPSPSRSPSPSPSPTATASAATRTSPSP